MKTIRTQTGHKAGSETMKIIEVEQTERNRDIAGFYATDSDVDPSDWTWNDRGNGPEIVDPLVFGPFASEAVAQTWIDNQTSD